MQYYSLPEDYTKSYMEMGKRQNIKLFISYAGIFGIQEAIHRGVPMTLFPFYEDQVSKL